MTWLAAIGLTLNVTKTHLRHTLEGDQPGMDFLGFHIRQYRVGPHQSGKGPRGHQRLGFKTLITPAKVNVKTHLAELGRIIRSSRAWPQAALIRQLNPKTDLEHPMREQFDKGSRRVLQTSVGL
jgi:RNA-directed DNA polymerase